ncbi:hypothetical protein JOD43_000385 [Pullulanibacillus pueri]|uniref:CotD family spore coat protein n=1 Tax=Pullulanibacillus pueri TaxID=1437324 RepID=UPI001E5BF170|nr:CotD family spore coat protein [Pullulanibacillus pueri]MBM7680226.1 hypothetical protein [Pullulanibacillus pueri]
MSDLSNNMNASNHPNHMNMSNHPNHMNMSNHPNTMNYGGNFHDPNAMKPEGHHKFHHPMMDPGCGCHPHEHGKFHHGMPDCPPSIVCADPPVNKTMPAMYDPAQHWQKNYTENIVIPHVHPSHTTHVKHTHYTHKHYFPHTESFMNTTSCSEVNCTPIPCPPCPPHKPFGVL